MNRGEVFRLRMSRRAFAHEQQGARYAVVVQETALELSTVVVVPTSTGARPAWFRPEVVIRGVRTRVMADQVRAVDRGRLGRPAGTLTPDDMGLVDRALETVLGLER